MITPLIQRLNILVAQLHDLNDLINKNLVGFTESYNSSFRESLAIDLSGINHKLRDLHREISDVMTKCYRLLLDTTYQNTVSALESQPNKISPTKKSFLEFNENK